MTLARDLYAKPQANILQVCGSRAKTNAAYRFFDHDDVAMENILKPHYDATKKRISKHGVVLALQDTTSLNYATHPAAEGTGLIGSKREGATGLLVHDTVAFSVHGTTLGRLDVQCWTRDPSDFGKKHRRNDLPIE